MSETSTPTLERESRVQDLENSTHEAVADEEKIFPRLDGEVMPVIAANAEVVAPCRWMGGAEVTLTTAMINYPVIMTEEIADQVLADVYEFLANARTEEPEEETEAEEQEQEEEIQPQKQEKQTDAQKDKTKPEAKSPAEAEEGGQKSEIRAEIQDQPSLDTADFEERFEKEAETIAQPELPRGLKKPSASENPRTGQAETETEAVAEFSQDLSNQPTQLAAKAEAAGSFAKDSKTMMSESVSDAPKTTERTGSTSESLVPELQVRVIDAPEEDASAYLVADDTRETEEPQPQVVSGSEPYNLQPETEIVVEARSAGPSLVDFEEPAVLYKAPEPVSGNSLTVGTDEEPEVINYPVETVSSGETVGEEAHPYILEQAEHEPDEQYFLYSGQVSEANETDVEPVEVSFLQPDDAPILTRQIEAPSPEQPVRVAPAVGEIEDSIRELSERIAAAAPETTKTVNEALDSIAQLTARIEISDGEHPVAETEIREELEELFTELVEAAGIDYEPELVEVLVSLTFKGHSSDEAVKFKDEKEADEGPQDNGTHEIIKKILQGVNIVKRTAAQAQLIGRSAIRLTVNFSA